MRYTVRYAHLKTIPEWGIGQLIQNNQRIGMMGNTGKSDGDHLHIDCVEGYRFKPWRLSNMEDETVKPCFKQLNYFIDDGLFNAKFVITSYIYDPEYMTIYSKNHAAYDVVPQSGMGDIYWNRSMPGQIISKGFDRGYGNYIHIGFDV